MEHQTRARMMVIFTSAVLLSVLAIGFLDNEWFDTIFRPENSLQLINVVTDTLLTGALVFLYFKQKQVLEGQVDLKRAELSGELNVDDVSYNEELIEVELSNLSSSEISKLSLYTEILPKNIQEKNIKVRGVPLQRADEHETAFGRVAGLVPRERSVRFTGKPSVYYTTEDGVEMLPGLPFFISELREAGIEEVKCRMWVQGTDQLGQPIKSKVFPWDKAIQIDTDKGFDQEQNLREILEESPRALIDESESEF